MRDKDKTRILETILAALESGGFSAWVKPWRDIGKPRYISTGNVARGLNFWTLSAAMLAHGFGSPFFITLREANKRGGRVKAGEHGFPVIIPKRSVYRETNESGETVERVRMFFDVRTEFNLEQTTLPPPKIGAGTIGESESLREPEAIVREYSKREMLPIVENGDKASYSPTCDEIHVPKRSQFVSLPAFYSALFHEVAHSTGHEKRLNRPGITTPNRFGSEPYGTEELIAELSAALLCSAAGIVESELQNSVNYLANWRAAISADVGLLVKAASQADTAVDYVLNIKTTGE